MDAAELSLLADTLRKTMVEHSTLRASGSSTASGHELDKSLAELGWLDMLDDMPDTAIRLVFKALGETGAHAPVLNDVVLREAQRPGGQTVPLPYAGGAWVVWERKNSRTVALDGELPIRRVADGDAVPLSRGRIALGWWLAGTSRAMLALARQHAVDRVQFGRPIASFQAIRHRLADTLVAIEGAEATLGAADDDLSSLLAKAAAGHAALVAARHCQQVLGGIGFTAEHELHRHVKRALILDGLLGSARELTKQAGAELRKRGSAPRLVSL